MGAHTFVEDNVSTRSHATSANMVWVLSHSSFFLTEILFILLRRSPVVLLRRVTWILSSKGTWIFTKKEHLIEERRQDFSKKENLGFLLRRSTLTFTIEEKPRGSYW